MPCTARPARRRGSRTHLGVGAVILGRRLAPRLGNRNATLTAGAGFVVATAPAFLVLPDNTDAVMPEFPAAPLWEFRCRPILRPAGGAGADPDRCRCPGGGSERCGPAVR
ncbi:CbtA family protein [Streptomyces lavendulae]|uniref:CbtA family protein n=1 Tax=Streptomyces lavendulae TaxID=1914 RepID=UPI0036A5BEE5